MFNLTPITVYALIEVEESYLSIIKRSDFFFIITRFFSYFFKILVINKKQ